MQQSLHLLQAPVLELRALVQQEMETNPVLEEPAEDKQETDEEWEQELDELRKHDEEWREYFSQHQQRSGVSREDAEERRQFMFDSLVGQESLSDHLINQLVLASEDEEELRAGEEIIGNLDDHGFLKVNLEEIAQAAQTSVETAQKTLSLIQTFHPPGIAARDLKETLQLQLQQRGRDNSLEYRIVTQCLDELSRKRYTEIGRMLAVTPDRVQEAATYIARLQPRPGSAFAPDQPHNVVQPEAAIVKMSDEWIVQMNHDPLPRLRINDTYKDLLGQATKDAQLKEYLKDKIRGGKFLIKCLHQRQETIENILKEIVKRQTDFLEKGVSQLKPLTMNQVAEVIGVHETTVSRGIANKYVQTPHGVFPIKFFFNYGYQTDQGEVMANTSIKEVINDLISREDSAHPLADSEIVQILSEKGIQLARRTVAKYRTELKILPSNLRRKI